MSEIAKKKDKVTLEVIGGNCEGVTGSCTSIKFNDRTILFECGGIQDGHTILENYKKNRELISKIKPKEVSMIIIGHNHHDHVSNICSLFARGCKARVIVPKGSTAILKEMWLDSAFINSRDCEYLSNKYEKEYYPLYEIADVERTLQFVEEFESNEIIELDDDISIRYSPAGHILCSQQTELYINGGSHTRKVVFTSDLGNVKTQDSRVFVENLKPITKSNIVIGECTYSKRERSMTKKDFEKDIEKIKTVVEQYCVVNKHRVLIPSFALDRTAYILWILYELFGKDSNFKIPIIIDSPLANRLLDCYSSILEDDAKEKFDEMMSWKNIKRVITPEDSIAAIADKSPKVICSSSGMLTAGRSIKWTQSILPCEQDCILFIGYAGEDTLAYKIKHNQEQKTINNKCQIIDLKSFSSHMQRDDLINYYKTYNCDKIYLVHSDKNSKLEFKEDLEKALADCCKSTRVIAVNKGTKISL